MGDPMFMNSASFDRAAPFRHDTAWLADRLGDAGTRIIPMWRNHNLICTDGTPRALVLKGREARRVLAFAQETTLLSVEDGAATFAADLSAHDKAALAPLFNGAQFMDLRDVGVLVDSREGSLLAFARGVMYWHRHNRFCGVCGGATESRQGGFSRRCVNSACGREHFPRTDPAVIMLITRPGPGGGLCLMGRQAVWPEGRYSTLAGFVEPGETLEAAVAREVFEETGVEVTDVRYQSSQPWPFPASLMLGFRGRATSHEISLNDRELEDARWFRRDHVAEFPKGGFDMPRAGSISRWLIDRWLAEAPE